MVKISRNLLLMSASFLLYSLASQSAAYSKPKATLMPVKTVPHDTYTIADSLPLKQGVAPIANEPVPPHGAPQNVPQSQGKSVFGSPKNIVDEQNLGMLVGNIIKSCMDKNWVLPTNFTKSSSQRPTIQVKVEFDEDGAIIGEPLITALTGSDEEKQVLTTTALKALKRCSPFEGLPRQYYDKWRSVIMNFTAPSR